MHTILQVDMINTPQPDHGWCTHCQVIPAQPGDHWCAGCLDELLAYLAASWQAA